jgi:hypothetical protein
MIGSRRSEVQKWRLAMKHPTCSLLSTCLFILAGSVPIRADKLAPPDVTVGRNLEIDARVRLDKAAGNDGLVIRVASDDPKQMLLSRSPETLGAESIVIKVPANGRLSEEFYIQSLGDSGRVTYTATAPGFESGTGSVTLTASGVVISGPSKFGTPITTTPRGRLLKLKVYSAQLDRSGRFAGLQAVRGGLSVAIHISSSNGAAGAAALPSLSIAGGSFTASTEFQPASAGNTSLSVDVPAGFSSPAEFTSVPATVMPPGIAVVDRTPLGENLQLRGTFILGEPAPRGGLEVTLTTDDASKLLVSASDSEVGSQSVTVSVPEGANSGTYFLQGLASHGEVTYSASAPGYRGRPGKITLTRSGVLLFGPAGPPDEGEALRPNSPFVPHGFFASLSAHNPVPIAVCTAFLEPTKQRAADITLQPLRPGLSLTVDLKNDNPAIGSVDSSVTIKGGSGTSIAQFVPLREGTTLLTVLPPEAKGFMAASNAASLDVIVKP